MNIEEAKKILEKFTTEHKLFNIKHSDGLEEAIETLLTAYEKEKEKNKELEKDIEDWKFTTKYVEDNYVSKDKIKSIIYPTPENPILLEVQQSEMYKKLLKEVEE